MNRGGLASLGSLIVLATLVVPAPGQTLDPAKWTLTLRARPTPPGAAFTIQVVARIDDGWRLYSLTQPPGGPLATRIWLGAGQPWTLAGPIEGPEPTTEFDEVFGMDVEAYVGRADFEIPVKHREGSAAGPVRVKVRYQMCSGELCLRPKTVALELRMETQEPDPTDDAAATPPPSSRRGTLGDYGRRTSRSIRPPFTLS